MLKVYDTEALIQPFPSTQLNISFHDIVALLMEQLTLATLRGGKVVTLWGTHITVFRAETVRMTFASLSPRHLWGLKGLNFPEQAHRAVTLRVEYFLKNAGNMSTGVQALRSIQLKICGERESAVGSSPTRTWLMCLMLIPLWTFPRRNRKTFATKCLEKLSVYSWNGSAHATSTLCIIAAFSISRVVTLLLMQHFECEATIQNLYIAS